MKTYNVDFYSENLRKALSATIPARTESYTPVPHRLFLDTLRQKIVEQGNEIDSTKIYINETGTRLTGYFNIRNNELTQNDLGIQMMAGFKNSYDKSMVAGFAAGGNVIVCGNGMVSGDLISFKRKHTGTIVQELMDMFDIGIHRMTEGFHRLVQDASTMRDYSLTSRQKAELLGVMYFEEGILKPDQLSFIRNQIKESEAFRGTTLWDLYNNVTESLKSTYVMNHIDNHIRLHDFMSEVAGIRQRPAVTAPEPIVVEAEVATV